MPAKASTESVGAERKLRRDLQGDLDNIVLMALQELRAPLCLVEQFAEDIRRYLQGLPVIRDDKLGYCAAKSLSGMATRHGAAYIVPRGRHGKTDRQARIAGKRTRRTSFRECASLPTRSCSRCTTRFKISLIHSSTPTAGENASQYLMHLRKRRKTIANAARTRGCLQERRRYPGPRRAEYRRESAALRSYGKSISLLNP
jgi:hypothetical protein